MLFCAEVGTYVFFKILRPFNFLARKVHTASFVKKSAMSQQLLLYPIRRCDNFSEGEEVVEDVGIELHDLVFFKDGEDQTTETLPSRHRAADVYVFW